MGRIEYDTVLLTSLPPSANCRSRGGAVGGKWKWVHDMMKQLSPELPVLRITLKDKNSCESLRLSIKSACKKYISPPSGYKFFTRKEKIGDDKGHYFYVCIEKNE